jgi:hypothetical protein
MFVPWRDKRISHPHASPPQADSLAPAYGRYSTTRWDAGEVVRDDYRITVPAGKVARLIDVGLYMQDASGAFHNLGVEHIRVGGVKCDGATR